MIMDVTTMSAGMIVATRIYRLTIFTFALLGIAAAIKYLRHYRRTARAMGGSS
jgi:hypothetical protein